MDIGLDGNFVNCLSALFHLIRDKQKSLITIEIEVFASSFLDLLSRAGLLSTISFANTNLLKRAFRSRAMSLWNFQLQQLVCQKRQARRII